MMLSKSEIKRINSLKIKKYRSIEGQFIAEGQKIIIELIQSGSEPELLVCTNEFETAFNNIAPDRIRIVSEDELSKISSLKQAPGCLGMFNIPKPAAPIPENAWILATDNIQDPGNLGTLIRIADWFGIQHILCSDDTVDAYNPKVVQATMGSIAHVHIHYHTLTEWIEHQQTPRKIYAGLLNGSDIRSVDFSQPGILLIGNEAKGISENLLPYITQGVLIPRLGDAESLNAGVAAGIIASFALLLPR